MKETIEPITYAGMRDGTTEEGKALAICLKMRLAAGEAGGPMTQEEMDFVDEARLLLVQPILVGDRPVEEKDAMLLGVVYGTSSALAVLALQGAEDHDEGHTPGLGLTGMMSVMAHLLESIMQSDEWLAAEARELEG